MNRKLPEQVSAVSPLAGAIDGSLKPKPKTRRTASKPALREVTSGILCFCGERFGEHQALEFMLHLRAEVGEDLASLKRLRIRQRGYDAKRRADPEVKERIRRKDRERYNRLRTDPEWMKKRASEERLRRHRREAANPELRDQRNAKARERRQRAKAEHDA